MSIATKPRSAIAVKVAEQFDATPRRLRTALIASIFVAVIMAIGAYSTYTSIQSTVQTVGRDAAPSIIAADHIQALLADANASAVNAVLQKDGPNGPSWTQYRSDINKAHDELVTASQNITYGDQERVPILTMESKLSEYEYTMGQAFANNSTDTLTAGNAIFRQYIQPASVALEKANASHLNQKYMDHRSVIGWRTVIVWLFLLLLLGVFVGIQVYLFRQMHRVMNIGYAVATILSLILLIYTGITLNSGEAQLVAAKQNSFDSINPLWAARATSYVMNADESLYLLHSGNADVLAKDEADYTNYAQLITAVAPQKAVTYAKSGVAFGGYLGIELSNITYPGERDAAIAAVNAWAAYTDIDTQIRQLLVQGNYQQALALDLGNNVGQSNYAFAQFDTALGQVIAINQHYFDQQIRDADALLRPFPFVLFGSLLAIIAACVYGMKPRLDEYVF